MDKATHERMHMTSPVCPGRCVPVVPAGIVSTCSVCHRALDLNGEPLLFGWERAPVYGTIHHFAVPRTIVRAAVPAAFRQHPICEHADQFEQNPYLTVLG